MSRRELLRLEHVTKYAGGIKVLDDLSLMILAGEQMQITGLSGCGMEELGQILSGQTSFDSGHIHFNGQDFFPGTLLPTSQIGICSVSRISSMVPQMTVAENIFYLRPHSPFRPLPSRRLINRQARALLSEFNLDISPEAQVMDLRLVEQQALEFVKAYARNARLILVRDVVGPYPAFQNQIFNGINRRLKEADIAAVTFSSSPFGFFDLYDRSIIMRDGTRAKTIYAQFSPRENPMKYAVEGELPEPAPRRNHSRDEMAFRCFNLSLASVQNLDFGVHRGEIVGLFDTVNTDLFQAVEALLTGASRPEQGYMLLGGHLFAPRNLEQAVKAGLGYISGQKLDGQLIEHISAAENILLPSMRKAPRLGIFRNRAAEKSVRALMEEGDLRDLAQTPLQDLTDTDTLTKVIILYHRWGVYRPRLLLYVDPFSQTDALLRTQILSQIEHLTSLGIGVLVLSPRLRDLVYLCDRILVYQDGRFLQEHRKQDQQFRDLNPQGL